MSTVTENIQENPILTKEQSRCEGDLSVPKNNSNTAESVHDFQKVAEPAQAKSLFSFISTQSDAGKSIGSLFSPPVTSASSASPQTEGGSSLFSGLKTLSGGLFQEEKTITPSLFRTKMGFPWQTEPVKQATPSVITSQPKNSSKPTSAETPQVQNVLTSDARKGESVGSTDEVPKPQICISSPELDSPPLLTLKDTKMLVETNPSAGTTNEEPLDNPSKRNLLNSKRLVKAL